MDFRPGIEGARRISRRRGVFWGGRGAFSAPAELAGHTKGPTRGINMQISRHKTSLLAVAMAHDHRAYVDRKKSEMPKKLTFKTLDSNI